MGCHKQTTNAKNRGHAREAGSILIGSGRVKFCCDLSCFMLATLTESWQSGFATQVSFLVEFTWRYADATSRSVLPILYDPKSRAVIVGGFLGER